MKKLLLSVASLALMTGAAVAADLPSRKAEPFLPPPPPPMWTGFYAGLNAGYGFGTNDNIQSAVLGQDATVIVNRRGQTFFGALMPTGAGIAQSGSFGNNQSGFIGGGQIGYNYQWGPNFLIGLEADMQGTGIRGGSHGGAGWANGMTGCSQVNGQGLCTNNPATITNTATSIGGTTVNAGVDWMGTVRGRLGYLWTPTMLVYATGGLTYGGVYANVRHSGVTQLDRFGSAPNVQLGPNPTLNYTFVGGGTKSQTLVGWNVGGGFEWMFMPNWSVKAEGIYWNMGSMNLQTASMATAPVGNAGPLATWGGTRVNYQGVIARAGVNYHFNWAAAAPVVARY